MDASIIVPAYNAKGTIGRCLQALTDQEADVSREIVVVESSGDGAADLVRERFPQVRLIASPVRLFPGAARNAGAREASGRIVLFIDADCIAERTWLSRMWQAHQQHPGCAAIAGAIVNGNADTAVSVSSYMNEFSHFFPYGSPRYVDYLPSGNLSYKAEVFRRYGGFDPDEPMYEDLMFNKELSRAGEKLLFDPTIHVAHHHRTNLREYLAHEFGRGRAAVAARRRGLLIGGSWVRYPALAFLALPGLYLRKSAVFPYRLARAYPSQLPRIVTALPCLHLALMVWHAGFLSETLAGRRST